jgi:hypothetical protein
MQRFRMLLLAALSFSAVFLGVSVPLAFGGGIVHRQGNSAQRPAAQQSAALPHVATPWRPGMPQWGVQVYWPDNGAPMSYLSRQAWTQARYLVGLHANSVAISFPFSTGTITSDEVRPGPATPSPARLGNVLSVFQQAGLRVTIRPILDESSLVPPNWRGTIAPANRDIWFAHYKAFLTPYLDVAQRHRVATFVIGTEFSSLQRDWRWKGVVGLAAKHFTGEIRYDANWDSYLRGPVAMPVKTVGVDAYFPVRVPDSAPVWQLVGGLNTWLNKKNTGQIPWIVFSEAGIAAADGAYSAPYGSYDNRPLNPKVQANWFTAVCDVVRQRHISGVYWWAVPFSANPFAPPRPNASRLDFAGRPQTEQTIRTCFTSAYDLVVRAPRRMGARQ